METQIDELKQICPTVAMCEEAGLKYIFLSGLVLPEGCTPGVVDALLCISPRDGYPSRLFFAQQIKSKKSQNWNGTNVSILDKNWFAYSWKLTIADQRPAEILANHLRAL